MDFTDRIILYRAYVKGYFGLHMNEVTTKRINKLIDLMRTKPAENMFDMSCWYKIPRDARLPKEAILDEGTCGTTACLAGFAGLCDSDYFVVAVSNRVEVGDIHSKHFGKTGFRAFGAWLEMPEIVSNDFCHPQSGLWRQRDSKDINHAIRLLRAYRDGGIRECYKIEKELG